MLPQIAGLVLLLAGATATPVQSFDKRKDINSPGILGFEVPPTRGFDYGKAHEGPCGGFAGMDNHTYWGMQADFFLKVANDVSNVRLSYSTKEDMSNPVQIAKLDRATAGYLCLNDPIDWSKEGFTMRDELTLQLAYYDETTKSEMYNCADIHLTSDHAYEPHKEFTCSNTSFVSVPHQAGGPHASPVHRAEGQTVSPLAAGFIGGAVVLGVVGVIAAFMKWKNMLFFSRRSRERASAFHTSSRLNHDHTSVDDISLQTAQSLRKQPM